MAAPGDFVRGADGAAVGRVESVLRSASGERILVARAFLRGGYAVLPASEVVAEEKDGEGLNWLTLDAGVGAVEVRGTFRRALGHLTPDP
ncbi:MAG TPA: hypothetical protein VFX49_16020, partial [Chloroflexota bacterium]|nr:hypothetical protein [Chloroflexota bacterium]